MVQAAATLFLDVPEDLLLRICTFIEAPKSIAALQQTCTATRDAVRGDRLLPLWLLRQLSRGGQAVVSRFLQKRKCSVSEADYLRSMARHAEADTVESCSEEKGREALWNAPLDVLLPWLACSMAACASGERMLAWLLDVSNGATASQLQKQHADLYYRSWHSAALEACRAGQLPALKLLLQHTPPPSRPPAAMQQLLLAACSAGQSGSVQLLLTDSKAVAAEALSSALELAATLGHANVVHTLLAQRTQANKRAPDVCNALQIAAGRGHTQVVSTILSAACGGCQAADQPSTSHAASAAATYSPRRCVGKCQARLGVHPGALVAAAEACKGGHASVLDALAQAGLQLREQAAMLMQAAALSGHAHILAQLVAAGADTASLTNVATTPAVTEGADAPAGAAGAHSADAAPVPVIMAVAAAGHLGVLKYMVESLGVDPHTQGDGVLCATAKHGHASMLAYLISRLGASTAARQPAPQPLTRALVHAVVGGHSDAARVLLDSGADAAGDVGAQCLLTAVRAGSVDVAKLLLEHGAQVGAEGGEPLRAASWAGDAAMLQMLLAHGAGASAKDYAAALQLAGHAGKVQAVCTLLEHWQQDIADRAAAPLSKVMLAREVQALYRELAAACGTALITAACAGHADVVHALSRQLQARDGPSLQEQVQLEQLEQLAEPALVEAARSGHAHMVQLLVQCGVVPLAALAGAPGAAALTVAIERHRVAAAQQLLKLCAEVGFDVLTGAAERGDIGAVRCLLEAATPTKPSILAGSLQPVLLSQGALDSALCHAVAGGHADIVSLMLAVGADVHASGDAALQWAVHRRQYRCVRLLLEAGADAAAVPHDAVRSLAEAGHLDVVRLLRQSAQAVEDVAVAQEKEWQQLQLVAQAGHQIYTIRCEPPAAPRVLPARGAGQQQPGQHPAQTTAQGGVASRAAIHTAQPMAHAFQVPAPLPAFVRQAARPLTPTHYASTGAPARPVQQRPQTSHATSQLWQGSARPGDTGGLHHTPQATSRERLTTATSRGWGTSTVPTVRR